MPKRDVQVKMTDWAFVIEVYALSYLVVSNNKNPVNASDR